MNGRIKVDAEWMSLEGAQVEDINGDIAILALTEGDEYYIQVHGSKFWGELGAYFWYGEVPVNNVTTGAEYLPEGRQGYFKQGTVAIYVRGANGPIDLIVRKVQ